MAVAALLLQCLAVETGAAGGVLYTVDANGNKWCLSGTFYGEGGWNGVPCTPSTSQFAPHGYPGSGVANVTITGNHGSFGWNNQPGASGPWPHSRYVTDGQNTWTIDVQKAMVRHCGLGGGSLS